MKKKITIDTSEIDRISIGGLVYDKLSFDNPDNVFQAGQENNVLTISQEDIRQIIKLVNSRNMFRDITRVDIV